MGTNFTGLFETNSQLISYLQDKTAAIDGMNMLFQILHNPYQQKQKEKLPYGYYLDRTQRVITHLYGWLQKIQHFYKSKFLPVVVFDGKPDTFKRLDHKDHASAYRIATTKYEKAFKSGDKVSARNYALSKSFMFPNCVHESKILLEAAGIPVIMAPTEAEAQCAYLQQVGLVDLVISNDYDVILFGAEEVVRKLTFQTRVKRNNRWVSIKPNLEIINAEENLQRLNLTREQLIDASLLLGNDFFPGIAKMGPTRVIQSLRHYKNLKNMKKAHPVLFKQFSDKKYDHIKKIFLDPESIHPKPADLRMKPFNRKGLEHLLLEDHSLNREKVLKKIEALEKAHAKFSHNTVFDPLGLKYEPVQFDIHLQRRLARAKTKKKGTIPSDALGFHSADSLPDDDAGKSKENKKSRKKNQYVQGRIAVERGLLKIKGKLGKN